MCTKGQTSEVDEGVIRINCYLDVRLVRGYIWVRGSTKKSEDNRKEYESV